MSLATIREGVLEVLRGTPVGDKIAREAAKAREAREAREAARAEYDRAENERTTALPKLEAEIEKAAQAVAALEEKLAPHREKERRLRDEYARTVRSIDRVHAHAETALRRSSPPLVNDHGPVWWALQHGIEHLRGHLLGADDDRLRRQAGWKPATNAPEDREPIERAQALVFAADAAQEHIDALERAREDLRDLQLEIDVDPAAVREILEACPSRCDCGRPLGLEAALNEALAHPTEQS